MLYFIYGENSYGVVKVAEKIRADFLAKHGDFNLIELDGAKASISQIVDSLMALPFLGDRRLVLIKNFLLDNSDKEGKKKLSSLFSKIPDTTDAAFIETDLPDKRESIFKELLKIAKVSYLGPVDERKLLALAKEKLQAVNISNEALAMLCQYIGPDLWRLENECAKITSLFEATGQEIGKKEIALLVEPINSLKIFDLTDAIARKDGRRALVILERFLKDGEDEFKIFNLIIFQLRSLLLISEARQNGSGSKDDIASQTGINPYVVQKTLPLASRFTLKSLKEFYFSLHETDWGIKSGRIDPQVAIPLLIVDFCKP